MIIHLKFLAIVFSIFAAIAVLYTSMLTNSGLDITDDAYYILNAQQPENIVAGVTSFGYYTGILYRLSGENIGIFRLIGIILLSVLSGFLAHIIWKIIEAKTRSKHSLYSHLLFVSLSIIGALGYYDGMLLTPSYNWLALVSILICAIGLLGAHRESTKLAGLNANGPKFFMFAALTGLGGTLAFLAKPTAAVVLAILAIFWVFTSEIRKYWWSFLGIAGLFALLFMLAHILVFEGGISTYYLFLTQGLKLAELLIPSNTIAGLSSQAFDDLMSIPSDALVLAPIASTGLLVVLVGLVFHKTRFFQTVRPYLFALSAIVVWTELFLAGAWFNSLNGQGLTLFLLLPLIVISGLYFIERPNKGPTDDKNYFALIRLIGFLFIASFAYAFGSTNGLMRQIVGSLVLFSLAYMLLGYYAQFEMKQKLALFITATLISITTIIVLVDGYRTPYRITTSLGRQDLPVKPLYSPHPLYVDQATATYFEELQNLAKQAGWNKNMFLIDLTGGSPGATLMLSAQFVGRPWLLGGYAGSTEFVTYALSLAPRENLERAWILTAPEGIRRVPDTVLQSNGLNFPEDYKIVGEVQSGYRNEKQILWNPKL